MRVYFTSSLVALAFGLAACGSDSAEVTASAAAMGDSQTPPTTSAKDVENWLAHGDYKAWHCESAPHAPKAPPSVHGQNRICSNDLASQFAGSPGDERPKGTAAVKELLDDAGANLIGYAVYLKTQPRSDQGASWYWYERVPRDSTAPHDDNGVVADGLPSHDSRAQNICVGCHSAAGSDELHTTSPQSADQVYTQVSP